MPKQFGTPDGSGTPVIDVIQEDAAPAIRVRHEGAAGNALEVVGPDGAALWAIDGAGNSPMVASDARVNKLISMFVPLSGDIGIGLLPNGTDYQFLYGFGSSRYWQSVLRLMTTNPGNYSLHQLQTQAEVTPMFSVDGADASVTRGAGVTGPNANATSFNGHYWFGTAAAQTFTFTTPANATRVGWRGPLVSNGGAAIVSIDGDKTLANLLPTAQDVINSGAYPNTILVANGGTANPTDRILDTYNAGSLPNNPDVVVGLADSLAAGAHTVVLTPVGVARSVGGGTRVYFSGYGYALAATTITDAGVVSYSSHNLNSSQGSAWEYALQATFPVAGSTFVGSIHGYEAEDSVRVLVDGAATTLTAGQTVRAAAKVDVVRQTRLVSPDDGSTFANVATTYHLDSLGLRVDFAISWVKSLNVTAAYVMGPMNGKAWSSSGRAAQADTVFSQGSLLNYAPGPITLTGVGDNFLGNVATPAAWTYGGNYGLLMWQPNVNQWTNNWSNSANFVAIEDRGTSTPFVTKIYFARIWGSTGRSEAVSSGSVWRSSTRYLVGRFPSGAAATIAA